MIPGLLLARISLLFVYGRRYIDKKRRKPDPPLQGLRRPALGPPQKTTSAFEEAVREKHVMPEGYSRGTAEELEEPAVAQLDERDLPLRSLPQRHARHARRGVRRPEAVHPYDSEEKGRNPYYDGSGPMKPRRPDETPQPYLPNL